MPRPLWKGAISFGMVTIPIKLYTATEEKDVHFNMLHAEDMSRIKQKRFCAEEDVEVSNDEIVKGYEITPGRYVTMEDEDFAKVPIVHVARRSRSRSSSAWTEIDPIYYQKTYYLEPEEVGMKPFALLMKTLEETERVAIAKVAMRQKEQLCTLRIREGTIVLETMFYADEVRSPKDLAVPGDDVKVNDKELAMAKMLVDTMTSDELDLAQYKDDYREALAGDHPGQVRGPGHRDAGAGHREDHRPLRGPARQRRGHSQEQGRRKEGRGARVAPPAARQGLLTPQRLLNSTKDRLVQRRSFCFMSSTTRPQIQGPCGLKRLGH